MKLFLHASEAKRITEIICRDLTFSLWMCGYQ